MFHMYLTFKAAAQNASATLLVGIILSLKVSAEDLEAQLILDLEALRYLPS
jgi:hypothetical protein